ncbi:MAG: hypothetical protein HY820_17570 [Acidobacteria bacterium]|nr:hypothetical protein [Acidobacteriota bacterium]
MFAAALMIAALGSWVPARWPSGDPDTLELLNGTPVNCLLLERREWSAAFAKAASERKIGVMGVVRPGGDAAQAVRTAKEQSLSGVVLEGDFADDALKPARAAAESAELAWVELPSRRGIRFNSNADVLGTYQGVWPGIHPEDEKDKSHAMPSGGPWIDTNTGFLRYAAAMNRGTFWMGVTPAPIKAGEIAKVDRYLMAIGDAGMVGARWIVALDDDFNKRLMARESTAVRDWKRIAQHLAFYEAHAETHRLPPYGQMAVVQDAASGALLSGSVLDMIAVKHTPIRPVPGERLSLEALSKAAMAVNLDPAALTAEQKQVLTAFSRAGGTVLNGPPGWKMPATSKNGLTVDDTDVKKLEEIWKEMNSMINRRNLGVRLFNVSSMLSYLQSSADGKRAVLQLVNYSGYPIENITAHVLGKFKKIRIYTPDGKEKALEPYDIEEGVATGMDIASVPAFAMLILEQ